MSYKTIHASFEDEALRNRIVACCAQEKRDPLTDLIWAVCCASDVEEAYSYALTSGNEDPGGDEGVVTDPMILGNVQAFFSPPGIPMP